MYPVHRMVTPALLDEFQDLLHVAYSGAVKRLHRDYRLTRTLPDVLTSSLSTSPFHKDQITAFMKLASRVRSTLTTFAICTH